MPKWQLIVKMARIYVHGIVGRVIVIEFNLRGETLVKVNRNMKRRTEYYRGHFIESVDIILGFKATKRWRIILKHASGESTTHKLKTKRLARELIDNHVEHRKQTSTERTPEQRRKLTNHKGPRTDYLETGRKLSLLNLIERPVTYGSWYELHIKNLGLFRTV